MRITQSQLRRIIKEEIETLREEDGGYPGGPRGAAMYIAGELDDVHEKRLAKERMEPTIGQPAIRIVMRVSDIVKLVGGLESYDANELEKYKQDIIRSLDKLTAVKPDSTQVR